jgi:hypothetical protein
VNTFDRKRQGGRELFSRGNKPFPPTRFSVWNMGTSPVLLRHLYGAESKPVPVFPPDRCRFLIFSVKARPGRQGRIVDKEDFIQKILSLWVVLLLIIHSLPVFLPCHLVCLVPQVLFSRQCKKPTLVRVFPLPLFLLA